MEDERQRILLRCLMLLGDASRIHLDIPLEAQLEDLGAIENQNFRLARSPRQVLDRRQAALAWAAASTTLRVL